MWHLQLELMYQGLADVLQVDTRDKSVRELVKQAIRYGAHKVQGLCKALPFHIPLALRPRVSPALAIFLLSFR